MAESSKMKDMPVNKLMIQMGIPMILSMALQAVYNIVDSAFVGNMRQGSEAYAPAEIAGKSICMDTDISVLLEETRRAKAFNLIFRELYNFRKFSVSTKKHTIC